METEIVDEKTLNAELDESIRSTLREIQARTPTEEPAEPAAEVVAEEPAPAPEKPRDAEGKFVKGAQKRHQPAQTQPKSAAQAEPTPEQPKAAPEPAAAEPEAESPLKFGADHGQQRRTVNIVRLAHCRVSGCHGAMPCSCVGYRQSARVQVSHTKE